VRVALDPAGQVYVQGALWRARSETGEPIAAGETVTVTAVDGLTLTVRPQQKEPAT
jgi:membrane protein implicated in regulation of membrane protease activity